MNDVALLLGPVVFRDFEIPPIIGFGGSQQLAVHQLVGGTRVIDSLGRNDGQIAFAGTFSGPDATLRARLVDELRVAGLPLPLTWDVFFYTVIISRFEADYQNGWWIPYRLTCTVLRDEASALIGVTASVAADVLSDVGTASGQAAAVGLDVSSVQSALTAPNATLRGTAAYAATQSGLTAARQSVAQGIGSAETSLGAAGLSDASTAGAGLAGLATALEAAQRLSMLTAADAYLGRAAVNLANAST